MTLDDLIARTRDEATSADPLDLLTAAVEQQQMLSDLGDELLDYFVQEARAAGCTWAHIGAALGVSKQAAQQRHSGLRGMRTLRTWLHGQVRHALGASTFFTRFAPESRAGVLRAQEEARRLRHDHLGSEHLLLGLLCQEGTPAARVLTSAGLELDQVRAATVKLLGTGEQAPRRFIPFDDQAKQALEQSLQEVRATGQDRIGTEQILLGLLANPDSNAARVLAHCGVDREALRRAVITPDTQS